MFRHIGLLFNEPPGPSQAALYLVIRNFVEKGLLTLAPTPFILVHLVAKTRAWSRNCQLVTTELRKTLLYDTYSLSGGNE